MKRGQLLGVAIAGVCGLGAFYGVLKLVNKTPARVVTQEVPVNMAQVLVAKSDIGLGQIAGPENFRWQDWPNSALSPNYIQRSARPNAVSDLTGAVTRTPLLAGEPITPMKLVKAGDGGVLAAILPAGMRAISTRIKEETGVGKLILPNDHVDVLLTTRKRDRPRRGDSVPQRACAGHWPADRSQGRQEARGGQYCHARTHSAAGRRTGGRQCPRRDLPHSAEHCGHQGR